jgi:hypothetical protein
LDDEEEKKELEEKVNSIEFKNLEANGGISKVKKNKSNFIFKN